MKKSKFFISLVLAGVLMFVQVSAVFAAPTTKTEQPLMGTVQEITLESDPTTALTTVLVTFVDSEGATQTVRISLETAIELGLVTLDADGNPVINMLALGQSIEIDPATVIADDKQHPVGSALSTFFSDIEGLDYATIMEVHESGTGFGVIAQVLWLTRKLEGTVDDFLALMDAKANGDFSGFTLEDGSVPTSWGQLKKAILDGDKKGNLGVVMSNKGSNNGNGSDNPNSNKDKDKDKNNNGKKP